MDTRHLRSFLKIAETGSISRAAESLGALPQVAPPALTELPMILPGPQHGLRQFIEQELGRHGTRIMVAQEIDAMAHIPQLIAMGYGFSILPLPAVQDDLAAGRISIARIGDDAIRRTLSLVRNAGKVVTHASVRCEDLTVKVLTGLIDKGVWMAECVLGFGGGNGHLRTFQARHPSEGWGLLR